MENYSDAGSALTGKISSRVTVIDQLNLRGALSTGFRAPTPGQSNLTNTSQNPSPDGSTIQTNGTIPPANPISTLKGGVPLKPEKSVNISLGFVTQPIKKLSFSADVYRIDIRDRIGLSQRYTLTPDELEGLIASGVSAAQGLTSFNFFVNGYKTRTQGLDLVLAYGIDLTPNSELNLTGAANFNKTEVLSFKTGVIDARQRQYIEDRLPKRVAVLSVEYVLGKASILARARDYGSWTEPLDQATDAAGNLIYNQKFKEEVFFDLAASYGFTKNAKLTLGAEKHLQQLSGQGALSQHGRSCGRRRHPQQRPDLPEPKTVRERRRALLCAPELRLLTGSTHGNEQPRSHQAPVPRAARSRRRSERRLPRDDRDGSPGHRARLRRSSQARSQFGQRRSSGDTRGRHRGAGLRARARQGRLSRHRLGSARSPGGRVFTVRRGSVVEEIDSRQEVKWDDDPDLFLDAGAARLPQHHQGILGYARDFGVRLEVLSNENRNALLHQGKAFGGKPQRNRRVNAGRARFRRRAGRQSESTRHAWVGPSRTRIKRSCALF